MKRYLKSGFKSSIFIFSILITTLAVINPARVFAGDAYFQQGLTYNIKVDLEPATAKLTGSETIIYENNSPDSLNFIYFHLYYNAFRPGSYLDFIEREYGEYGIANLSKRRMGFVEIDKLMIDGADTRDYTIDNTIMKLNLGEPLRPGEQTTIYIEWTGQIPARGSRTAHTSRHFDVGQWYPKPAVYDRFGWHAQQYLDFEFFADYADFDIELTLPSEYIVAYMGELQNEEDIYGFKLPVPQCDTILVDVLKDYGTEETESGEKEHYGFAPSDTGDDAKSAIYDYDESSYAENDTVSSDVGLKTWKFKARNVHDFAFCADPGFMVDMCRYRDVTIKSYYLKSNKDRWQRNVVDYTRKAISYYSEKYMPYPYGQYSTVSGLTGGGMEYPQLTMIWQRSGSRGDYNHILESTVAHEVGHAWFYGILGFNETEQAFLDEGLTSFAEIDYMEHYYGRVHNNYSYDKWWQKKLLPNGNSRNDAQKSYIRRALELDEDPISTPANLFKTYSRYYNASYEKAASVYYMLQYVMGDQEYELFLRTLFEKWSYRHPYFEDVKKVAEEIHGSSLEWFFRQWFETTWRLDYSLNSVHSRKVDEPGRTGYNVTFSISRKERCVSPLDIVLYYNRDVTDTIYLSENVWEGGRAKYDTTVFLRGRPRKVVINPDRRLADIDMLDNSTGIPPVNWQLMVPRFIYRHNYVEYYVDSYTISHHPLLWYNSIDGIKTGYELDGSFLGIKNNVDLTGWVGLNNGRIDYSAGYHTPLFSLNPDLVFHISSRELEGRGRQESGFGFKRPNYDIDLSARRYYVFNTDYIRRTQESGDEINTVEMRYNHRNDYQFSRLDFGGSVSTSIWGSDYDFSRLTAGFQYELLDIFGNNTRIKIRTGIADGPVPAEEKFYLSSAGPLEIWDSPLFRSRGTLPDSWIEKNRVFMPGGGGLYGYYGMGLAGDGMFTAILERDLPRIGLPSKIPYFENQWRRVSWSIYAGSGMVWDRTGDFKARNFLSEAGFRFNYKIPYLEYLMDECVLHFYLPLWLSDPYRDDDNFDWRWVIGITR